MVMDQLKIVLRGLICLQNLTQDDLQAIVSNLDIKVEGDNITFVTSTGGIQVKFLFGSDGNFNGVYAQLGGVSIPIIFGTDSSNLEVFEGPPGASNPGPGWEVDVEASKVITHSIGDEANWRYFIARRVPVVSTIP